MGSNTCVCRIACGSGSNYGGNTVNEVAQQEKMMTTKELAEVLGVHKDTVVSTVKRLELDGVLRSVAKNSQGGYLFNEEQATAIKLEIQKHHNLQSRQIDTVSTETEENLIVMQAVAILQRKAAKALKLPYGNIKLFERLRNEGLLNLDNTPRQEQVNQGNFKVVVKYVNEKIGNKVSNKCTGNSGGYRCK